MMKSFCHIQSQWWEMPGHIYFGWYLCIKCRHFTIQHLMYWCIDHLGTLLSGIFHLFAHTFDIQNGQDAKCKMYLLTAFLFPQSLKQTISKIVLRACVSRSKHFPVNILWNTGFGVMVEGSRGCLVWFDGIAGNELSVWVLCKTATKSLLSSSISQCIDCIRDSSVSKLFCHKMYQT